MSSLAPDISLSENERFLKPTMTAMEINMIDIPRAILTTAIFITTEDRFSFEKENILDDINLVAFIFFLSLQK